jgi:hypothetical protein
MGTAPQDCAPTARQGASTRPIPAATAPMPRRGAPGLSSLPSHRSPCQQLQQRPPQIRITKPPAAVFPEDKLRALLSAPFWAPRSSQRSFSASSSTGEGEAGARTAAFSTNHHPLDKVRRHHRWVRLARQPALRCCLVDGLPGCRLSRAIPATRRRVTRPGTCMAQFPELQRGIVEAGGGATTNRPLMGSATAWDLNVAMPGCSVRPQQC